MSLMSTRPLGSRKNVQTGLYYPNLVPMSAIRRLVRQIAQKFRPDKIILFGSYADGTPTPDSDVDLLVVMRTRNQIEQAAKIDETLERGFPLDLLVRTPKTLAQRLQWGDWFLRDIVARGKILYEKADRAMGSKSGKRLQRRAKTTPRPDPR
jgi:predicted nucleotidyltransferase